MSDTLAFDPIYFFRDLGEGDYERINRELTPLEKVVCGWETVDEEAGLAWVGEKSICLWSTDQRRITITLHDAGGGRTVRISTRPDPRFRDKEEAA